MLKILALVGAITVAPFVANAQSQFLSSPEDTRKVAEGVAASLASGNILGAMKELRPLSVIPPTELDLFEAQINSQVGSILRQYGSATGYEFLHEDRLGTRLIRQQYLVFHEKAPLRWNFVFYRSEKGWVLSHFRFDGNAALFFPNGG